MQDVLARAFVSAAIAVSLSGCATRAIAPAVSDGYVHTADDVSLYYRRVGTGDQLVVYVHGGPGSNFRGNGTLMDSLATRERTLVMYDQRGAGLSTVISDPARLTADDHVRDLEAVRNHFGASRMSLIGLSWGSGLTVLYAAKHPERVERLLLVSPMSPTRAYARARGAVLAKIAGEEAAKRQAAVVEAIKTADDDTVRALCREHSDLTFRNYLVRPTSSALKKAAERCEIPPAAIRNRFVVGSAVFASLGDYDFRPLLRKLQHPVLVLEGADTTVPLDATAEWVQALPNARWLLIPHAGHELFLDEPQAFLDAASEFLGGRYPRRSERP